MNYNISFKRSRLWFMVMLYGCIYMKRNFGQFCMRLSQGYGVTYFLLHRLHPWKKFCRCLCDPSVRKFHRLVIRSDNFSGEKKSDNFFIVILLFVVFFIFFCHRRLFYLICEFFIDLCNGSLMESNCIIYQTNERYAAGHLERSTFVISTPH